MASKYKIISIAILLIGCIGLFYSCDPIELLDPPHKAYSYVINNTQDDIILEKDFFGTSSIIIKKDSIKKIIFLEIGKDDTSGYFFASQIFEDDNFSVSVYSKDRNVLLKTWNRYYTDTTQKQFFRESDWIKKEYEKTPYIFHEYTFTINQEDINK